MSVLFQEPLKFILNFNVSMFIVYFHYGLHYSSIKVLPKSLYLSNCCWNVIESRVPSIVSLIESVGNILELKVIRIEHLSCNELSRLKRHHKSINKMPESLSWGVFEFKLHYFLSIVAIFDHKRVSSNLASKHTLIALLIDPLQLILPWLLSELLNLFDCLNDHGIINL